MKYWPSRSNPLFKPSPSMRRVWIEILLGRMSRTDLIQSPSMRRVWIEITYERTDTELSGSPSMRRVWIEISYQVLKLDGVEVTLHAEGVD